MEDITIGHYEVDTNGQIAELDRVKLSGKVSGSKSAITWVAGCALAILTGDLSVRIWDIETNDNYVLSMELTATGADRPPVTGAAGAAAAQEVFTCVAYCADTQTLSAGTSQGNLYTWRRAAGSYGRSYAGTENQWQLTNVTPVRGTIKSLVWGTTEANRACMMVNCLSSVFILKEQSLLSAHARQLWATQKKSNELLIRHANGREALLHTDISIIHLALNELHLVVTNGRTVAVYRIDPAGTMRGTRAGPDAGAEPDALAVSHVDSFAVECGAVYLYEQSIVALGTEQVKIYSLSGIILQELVFNANEGECINSSFDCNFSSGLRVRVSVVVR